MGPSHTPLPTPLQPTSVLPIASHRQARFPSRSTAISPSAVRFASGPSKLFAPVQGEMAGTRFAPGSPRRALHGEDKGGGGRKKGAWGGVMRFLRGLVGDNDDVKADEAWQGGGGGGWLHWRGLRWAPRTASSRVMSQRLYSTASRVFRHL